MADFKKLSLTLPDLCWVLGITKQRVAQLEEAGIVEKAGRNRYAANSIRRYAKFLREGNPGSKKWNDARTELLIEKLHAAKLDRFTREGKLIPAEQVTEMGQSIMRVFTQALFSTPAKIAVHLNPAAPAKAEAIMRAALSECLESLQALVRIADKETQAGREQKEKERYEKTMRWETDDEGGKNVLD